MHTNPGAAPRFGAVIRVANSQMARKVASRYVVEQTGTPRKHQLLKDPPQVERDGPTIYTGDHARLFRIAIDAEREAREKSYFHVLA